MSPCACVLYDWVNACVHPFVCSSVWGIGGVVVNREKMTKTKKRCTDTQMRMQKNSKTIAFTVLQHTNIHIHDALGPGWPPTHFLTEILGKMHPANIEHQQVQPHEVTKNEKRPPSKWGNNKKSKHCFSCCRYCWSDPTTPTNSGWGNNNGIHFGGTDCWSSFGRTPHVLLPIYKGHMLHQTKI